MKTRDAWRFRLNGTFQGSFLQPVGAGLVVKFQDRNHWTTLAGVSANGVGLWEKRWEDFAYFFCSENRLFVDGDQARRIDPDTGEVLATRNLGASVYIGNALEAGPVYRIPEEKKYFGLDGETLSTLWEWQDEREDFYVHDGRLCWYRPQEGITIRDLPSLEKHGPLPVTPVPADGCHAHFDDLFCQFGYTDGGRAAVNLRTGFVEWRHEGPAAYGLMTFDRERGYSPWEGVSAYDLATGRQLWQRTFGQVPTSPPIVRNGRLYVATGDRFVHVLQADTGETVLSHELKFKITGTVEPSPAVALGERKIVVGTRKELICIETD